MSSNVGVGVTDYLGCSFRNSNELDSLLSPIEKIDLNHVLRSTWIGKSLLLHYNKHNSLERHHRKLLVDLIINYISQLSSEQ